MCVYVCVHRCVKTYIKSVMVNVSIDVDFLVDLIGLLDNSQTCSLSICMVQVNNLHKSNSNIIEASEWHLRKVLRRRYIIVQVHSYINTYILK